MHTHARLPSCRLFGQQRLRFKIEEVNISAIVSPLLSSSYGKPELDTVFHSERLRKRIRPYIPVVSCFEICTVCISSNPISSCWLSKRQARALSLILGDMVLDVGSRTEKIRNDAVSVDIDRRFRPDICASIECLPIRTKTFEYITMLEVIEHLDDSQLDAAMRECRRVSDLLILSTPNCDSKIWNRVVWPLWSHTVGREWIGAHKQFFGKKSLEELLEQKCGMKILKTKFSRWNLLVRVSTDPGNSSKSIAPSTFETTAGA